MNFVFVKNFLRANRRSNIYLYPEDWKQLPITDAPPKNKPRLWRWWKILAAKKADKAAAITAL